MARIEIETAKTVASAWGCFVVSKDGSKVEPCEAYALDAAGNYLSGDGDDITQHIASGGVFLTYEAALTKEQAQATAESDNARHAEGVAAYGWNDDGSRIEARPLPAGTVFYDADETLCVVAAPAVKVEPVAATMTLESFRAECLKVMGAHRAADVASWSPPYLMTTLRYHGLAGEALRQRALEAGF